MSDVIYGCANQAGEDNRNVARMASLLAGCRSRCRARPQPPVRLGLDAVGTAARAIRRRRGRADDRRRRREHEPRALRDAQGRKRLLRSNAVYDTTIGWRFVNKLMKAQYGVDSMPETAENVATDFGSSARRRTAWPWPAQIRRWRRRRRLLRAEITPVSDPAEEGRSDRRRQDEHPRETSLEALAKLKGVVRPDGTVTAGNASGVNDGACALLWPARRRRAPRPDAARPRGRHGHRRRGAAHHGHRPGAGDAQGAELTGLTLEQLDVIELNEAFAAQGLAVLRGWAQRRAPRHHRDQPAAPQRGRYAPYAPCASASARHRADRRAV